MKWVLKIVQGIYLLRTGPKLLKGTVSAPIFYRDGVLILVLVLILTRVLFSVLCCTLYLAKFMSTCTRTYLSTVTKNPVLMSTLRVPLSTFLNFNQIEKKS